MTIAEVLKHAAKAKVGLLAGPGGKVQAAKEVLDKAARVEENRIGFGMQSSFQNDTFAWIPNKVCVHMGWVICENPSISGNPDIWVYWRDGCPGSEYPSRNILEFIYIYICILCYVALGYLNY